MNALLPGMAVQRFIWRREYRALSDRRFTRFAEFIRSYFLAYLLLLLVTFAVFVFERIK